MEATRDGFIVMLKIVDGEDVALRCVVEGLYGVFIGFSVEVGILGWLVCCRYVVVYEISLIVFGVYLGVVVLVVRY